MGDYYSSGINSVYGPIAYPELIWAAVPNSEYRDTSYHIVISDKVEWFMMKIYIHLVLLESLCLQTDYCHLSRTLRII